MNEDIDLWYVNAQGYIDEAKKKADAYLKATGFNDAQIKHIRNKAKNDLFFLCYSMLGYNKLSPNLHGDLCLALKKAAAEKYRLLLLARSHFKSTVFTIGDTIQTVLPDDLGTGIYPRNLGTDVRILIAHEKADAAGRFLFSITQHFTVNPVLTAFFPECVPNARKHRINQRELELPRNNIWSEPTIDTMGVGGKNQGRHYNKIKLDDIYGAEARDSIKERQTTIDWFDNVQSFFITPETDHLDICGTRWAFDDIYQHIITVYGDQLWKYIKGAIENGQPVFPEQFSLKSFEILKKNAKVWNAQYANNPSEGAASFQHEWLKYYNKIGRDITIFSETGPEEIPFDLLDRVILIDPAVTGKTGICVTGTDRQNRIFVLHAEKGYFKTEQLMDKVFKLVVKFQPRLAAFEEVIFSALYDPLFSREMKLRGLRFRLETVKVGSTAKSIRVNGLANYFSTGQIYLHADQTDLITEFQQFGATEDYHILDAMSMGPKLWRAGGNRALRDKYKEAEELISTYAGDPITGYSRIR